MHKKKLDAVQKQILRGRILTICEKAQPYGAGLEMLDVTLKKEGFCYEMQDIKQACYYLEQKGLISMTIVKNVVLKISRNISMITARGIDFLEGSIEEEGIALMEE